MERYSTSARLADLIEARAAGLAESVVAAQPAADPDLARRYGERERRKAVEDATHTLKELAEALANDDPATFLRLDGILLRVGLPRTNLGRHLVLLRDHLLRELPDEHAAALRTFLDPAVRLVMPTDEVSR